MGFPKKNWLGTMSKKGREREGGTKRNEGEGGGRGGDTGVTGVRG